MPRYETVYGLEKTRCLNNEEIARLRKILLKRYEDNGLYYGDSAIKQWFLCELGLSTGLRVSEMKNLKLKDLNLNTERPFIWVENGKGHKSRRVEMVLDFKNTLQKFLEWKKITLDPIEPESFLLFSKKSHGQFSIRGLEIMFKRCLEISEISKKMFSIHSLRHTYAKTLYKATKHNIRYVQKQLGHSSIRVTEIYLQALNSELQEPLKSLY